MRKITYKDKASYDSTPPCRTSLRKCPRQRFATQHTLSTHTATHTATALNSDSQLSTHSQLTLQLTLQQPSATIRNSAHTLNTHTAYTPETHTTLPHSHSLHIYKNKKIYISINTATHTATALGNNAQVSRTRRGGGLGSRPKKMYGERLGDGVEYHLMKPTPRR